MRSTSSSTESSTESSSTSPSDEFPPQTAPNQRLEPAPSTFEQCIRQAQGAVEAAFKDGFNLVEVEFPPLQQDYLEDSGSSAYDVSSANVRLASRFAQTFAAEGKEVSVLLPDEAELDRAVEDEGSAEFSAGVTLRTLRSAGTRTAETLDKLLMSFVGRGAGPIQPLGDTDIYVAIVFSCQELPDLEELHRQDPDAKIVLFNLRLDTLRGDLGLPAFPSKSLHYRFLSRFKPVYLLRTRQYSRTISKKPFLVNYQGAQFRVYPGDYQCLLDVGNRYKRVQNSPVRQTLGDFKESLTNALQLNEEKEGKVASFFRKGFKNRTWWEEVSAEEASSNWRT
ncbi:unnamed protein product [Ascophyllum nodosum]